MKDWDSKAQILAVYVAEVNWSTGFCDTDFPNVESGTADGFTRLDKLLAE